jgi:hypothetical protein
MELLLRAGRLVRGCFSVLVLFSAFYLAQFFSVSMLFMSSG